MVFTTGIIPGAERKASAEGIEMDMAVSALSRYVALKALLPRLTNPDARVFVMGFPGSGQKANLDDLNSETKYDSGLGQTHMNTVSLYAVQPVVIVYVCVRGSELGLRGVQFDALTYTVILRSLVSSLKTCYHRAHHFLCLSTLQVAVNEALVQYFGAMKGKKVYGLNPGLIATGIRSNWATGVFANLMETLVGWFSISAEQYAEYVLPLFVAPELSSHPGASFSQRGVPILPSPGFEDAAYIDKHIAALEALVQKAQAAGGK